MNLFPSRERFSQISGILNLTYQTDKSILRITFNSGEIFRESSYAGIKSGRNSSA